VVSVVWHSKATSKFNWIHQSTKLEGITLRIDRFLSFFTGSADIKANATTTHPPQPNATHPQTPLIRLLFSLIPRHRFLILTVPAMLCSMASGGIAPFMTIVIGQAFNAFAQFPSSSSATAVEKSTLIEKVGISCLELIALAVGSIALGSLTSCLWIWVGETNAMNVRKAVYQSVIGKEMAWFDAHMGAGE
jgi:ATP-binding cassette, subfamily B (MDR/TAP), member 1